MPHSNTKSASMISPHQVGLSIHSGATLIWTAGHPRMRHEGSPLAPDLVRSVRESRASWRCGFRVGSLRGVPTAAARLVGHECLQMTDRRNNSSSRSNVSSIFLFHTILSYFHDALLCVVFIMVMVMQLGGYIFGIIGWQQLGNGCLDILKAIRTC
jgi:hypothetical protein